MPELPEVEVLARHLDGVLRGCRVRSVRVRRAKSTRPTSVRRMSDALSKAVFTTVQRRGKYLVFRMKAPCGNGSFSLLGHLGMTGRMYLQPSRHEIPTHTAVLLNLGLNNFIFEDTRYFGRLTLDDSLLANLGPEPLEDGFDGEILRARLGCSRQAIKVKLLDQCVVAGLGNIYASEALFRARISPRKMARRLTRTQGEFLAEAIHATLREAILGGSTVPLDFAGAAGRDGFFYYGRAADAPDYYKEHLAVYGRDGEPCVKCATLIRRIVQAARGTWYCPVCQSG